MARKRFNAAERAIIAAAAAQDLRVQWQNVTQWHPATLDTGEILTDDGWQYATGVNHGNTKTISPGQRIRVTPGHVRPA
jgi:hypothetical protein